MAEAAPIPRAAEIAITDADFERFRDYFYRHTGIFFDASKRYFVDKRLRERIAKTEQPSFRAWFALMRFEADGGELQRLVNEMTVNETYFCREAHQFRCLTDEVLGEVLQTKRPGDPVRIWSLPCSTGEEPYSIAVQLLEHWAPLADVDVEIVASDIDSKVLEHCRRGVYGKRSVQHVPLSLLSRYFTALPESQYQVGAMLQGAVDFRLANVVDPRTAAAGPFDVVFCRNLLIYFDELSRRKAAETLYDALRPGGFIFLGHSESMSRISSLFHVRKFAEAIAYQKPFENES